MSYYTTYVACMHTHIIACILASWARRSRLHGGGGGGGGGGVGISGHISNEEFKNMMIEQLLRLCHNVSDQQETVEYLCSSLVADIYSLQISFSFQSVPVMHVTNMEGTPI